MLASLLNRVGIKLAHQSDPKAQDGRRPGEGPPDLDQMWRDFNARLNRLFSGANGDNGGQGGFRPEPKGAGPTVGIIAGVIGLIWLGSGTFIVQEGHTGVVTTFGEVSHTAPAGLNWRWPAPFQAHQTVNVSQVRTEEIGYKGTVRAKNTKESLMLTDDENIIDVAFAVQYTLKDPIAWLYNNRDTELTVRQVAETSIREVVGKAKTDYVLSSGQAQIAFDTQKMMQGLVDLYKMGVQITNVTIQNAQPPEQVQGAFEDVNKAGQDKARAKNEGEAYANDVIPRAEGAATRLVKDAEAYKIMVVQNAEGNAARFNQVLAEYQKAPAVTRDRMYLDTMQQIFTSASKVMVDAKAGNSMLYLPLDKLIAQTAANDAAVGSKSGPVQMTPPVPPELPMQVEQSRQRDNRSRESSRDREGR
ncbi:FtsH protease activity modulator HflK [Massilia sp. CF038]|uniref:FtsH protease activity modulator HflK n=1 Tax=Massilia sp. CF038 TaxID=1881045 RepID=UPI00090F0B25|nr:FtsH protease activity modulator HflK [Massilia sp. CF038]SHG53797.1 protease FtsH subunit HflK [Massilia sp. CF038]